MPKPPLKVQIHESGIKSWAPYFALAVSLVAVFISIWQSYEARQHNRKTVMPQVLPYTTNDPFNHEWGIFLQNEGLGPAFVDFHKVTLDGKEMTGFEIIDQLIKEGFIGARDDALTRYYDEGLILKAGSKTPVLAFVGPRVKQDKAPEFQQMINERINVEYVWCSIYEECRASCSSVSCKKPDDIKTWQRHIENRK